MREGGSTSSRWRSNPSSVTLDSIGLYMVYAFPQLVREGVRDGVNLIGPEGVLLTYGKSTS